MFRLRQFALYFFLFYYFANQILRFVDCLVQAITTDIENWDNIRLKQIAFITGHTFKVKYTFADMNSLKLLFPIVNIFID